MKFTANDICKMALFAAASAVLAQIAFPLPFSPVPISLGMLGTFVSGVFLRPKCAFFTQLCYLTLGAAGMPVFGHFTGGLGVMTGPTGGYLLAYPFMALTVSLSIEYGERILALKPGKKTFPLQVVTVGGLTVSVFVCYALGTSWLMRLTGLPLSKALTLAVYPFLPLDAVKIAFSILTLLPLRERVLRTTFVKNTAKREA